MLSDDTTIGWEIECPGVAPVQIPWVNMEIHDDGSVRQPVYIIGEGARTIALIPQQTKDGRKILPAGARAGRDYGYEAVVGPYPVREAREVLERMAKYYYGVGADRNTASIHFHVSMREQPWTYVRSLMLWANALEAIIFRLSCGGGMHRGEQAPRNDYRYTRPFSAPITALNRQGDRVPMIDMKRVRAAKSATELLVAYGRADYFWSNDRMPRWPWQRAHMLNLMCLWKFGTVEWRVFDGRYRDLPQLFDVVWSLHRLADRYPTPEEAGVPYMPLGSTPDISMAEVSQLLDTDVSSLWGTRWCSGPENLSIPSHYGEMEMPTGPAQLIRSASNMRDSMDDGTSTWNFWTGSAK